MSAEDFKRKLTAILSADVEGYSILMRDDEEATIRTLTTYRTAMTGLIQQYRGRVVDSPGDNILAEFTSAVDAVNCAVEMQRELAERNAELPESRRMEFRIGVNVGDVVEEGERIYGDGVNIAARMEGLAEGGGICISGTAYDQVKHKLGLEYEYLGEQEVKNIAEPVPAYRVLSFPGAAAHRVVKAKRAVEKTWRNVVVAIGLVLVVGAAAAVWHFYFRTPPMEKASVEKMAYPLPDKPSIAVLPFTNMSGDPEQEYIGDGISENIITALSKVAEMFVIARNSTFTYKGKAVKIQQVAEELGVQYVLEGSFQKSGDRVRVTAQLIDALRGQHLWSEKYDRKMRELFDLQDEITQKMVVALQLELTPGDQARLYARSTDNLEAWSNVVKGYDLFYRWNKEDNARARELFESAIKLDPGYGSAWAWLALSYAVAAQRRWTDSPAEYYKRAHEAIQKALNLDDKSAHAHSILGMIYLTKGEHGKAIVEGKKSISLDPNDSFNYGRLGQTMFFAGQFEDAIELLKKAMRLSPYYPIHYLAFLGRSYAQLGRCEEAIPIFNEINERCRRGECPPWMGLPGLANCYAELGREEEAQKFLDELLRLNPSYFERKYSPFKDKAIIKRRTEQLRKFAPAEKPLLPLPDKPSIAVLPFVNMSGDSEQEYFSDGITEEIITALSKSQRLFVIARESTFSYKGKSIKIPTVGRELGVKYVLEGTVRMAEDQVRVTAQLIDATTAHHLWAERYDRDLKDIFAIQDEITLKILSSLQVKLTEGEQARMWAKKTKNLDVYLKLMEALSLFRKGTKESLIRFGQLGQEIVDMAPESVHGYRVLAWYYWALAMYGGKPPRENIAKSFKLAQKALSLDESDADSHALLGSVYLLMRQYEKAIAEGERSVELMPNGAMVHGILGGTLSAAGRPDEAIDHLKQGIRLNPFPASWYFHTLGRCYIQKGQYEEALIAFKKALNRSPDAQAVHTGLAVIYVLLNRQEEARAAAKKVLEMNPNFSVEHASKAWPYKNQADLKLVVDAMRQAGLK